MVLSFLVSELQKASLRKEEWLNQLRYWIQEDKMAISDRADVRTGGSKFCAA